MQNRSVPVDTILPHLVYRNVGDAMAWLSKTFGFTEHYRYGNTDGMTSGAQMHLGNAWIMLTSARPGMLTPAQSGCATQSLTVFVEDIDGHFQRTKLAGATIVEDLHVTVYGERQYGTEDLDGHRWLFSQHARDVNPSEWGASVQPLESRLRMLARPRFCYLEIPALEVLQSISFYEKVFGWTIRGRDSAHPSFDDATGNISGAWVTGRNVSRQPGLLPYIWVDHIDATLAEVAAQDGEVVQAPHLDSLGGEWIAAFRDPAGNLIGLYQEGPR